MRLNFILPILAILLSSSLLAQADFQIDVSVIEDILHDFPMAQKRKKPLNHFGTPISGKYVYNFNEQTMKIEPGGFVARKAQVEVLYEDERITIVLPHIGVNVKILAFASVAGHAHIEDEAVIDEFASVHDYSIVRGRTHIKGHAKIGGHVMITGQVEVFGYAEMGGKVEVHDNVKIYDNAKISGQVVLTDQVVVRGKAELFSKDKRVFSGDQIIEESSPSSGSKSLFRKFISRF